MSEEIKNEVLTEAESKRIESVFFEDDAEIKLRDGKVYKIPPVTLKKARRLMQLLKTVNTDIVLLNFAPTGDEEVDAKRENDLFEVLSIAFSNYPEVNREYLEEYIDIGLASEIIDILIGLNGIKKLRPQSANQE